MFHYVYKANTKARPLTAFKLAECIEHANNAVDVRAGKHDGISGGKAKLSKEALGVATFAVCSNEST